MQEAIVYLQQRLVAPKEKYNNFGKYHHRTLEGILKALKPLLSDVGCSLKFCEEVMAVSQYVYIKSTATIYKHGNDDDYISCYTVMRDPIDKKGMDGSQVTGGTVSYARKYALSGLLAIDDTKDADSLDNSKSKATTLSGITPMDHSKADDAKYKALRKEWKKYESMIDNLADASNHNIISDIDAYINDIKPYS